MDPIAVLALLGRLEQSIQNLERMNAELRAKLDGKVTSMKEPLPS
jgi:hypothetical protein